MTCNPARARCRRRGWWAAPSTVGAWYALGLPRARGTGPVQVAEQGDLRHVVDQLEVGGGDHGDEWLLSSGAAGVPVEADGVELLGGHGRDAGTPAVHRRPEPLQ